MARVMVVTGFMPIPGHPRVPERYTDFGNELIATCKDAHVAVHPFYGSVEQTWLMKAIRGRSISYSVADNPEKNTLAYHCVQHQKFAWLMDACSTSSAEFEIYVWIDYGIMHVPGVTKSVIREYLRNVKPDPDDAVQLPGCWGFNPNISTGHPCWRFCGGLMAVPRRMVYPFTLGCMNTAMEQIERTSNIDWEVNTMARWESNHRDWPIRWYQADHNETMFTGAP